MLPVGGTVHDASWASISFPVVMDVVLFPTTNTHRVDLSHAVQSQNHPKIIAALEAGQDPGCWCLVQNTGRNEPVLLAAAAAGYSTAIRLTFS